MKTLIVYSTKHGTTGKIAGMIADRMNEKDMTIINLKENKNPDISEYERIIIGGSIYMGKIRKRVQRFIENNHAMLLKKEIGLFICCMTEERKEIEKTIELAFPAELIEHSKSVNALGGEFMLEKMNFLERFMMKTVGKITESKSSINNNAIDQFSKEMKV